MLDDEAVTLDIKSEPDLISSTKKTLLEYLRKHHLDTSRNFIDLTLLSKNETSLMEKYVTAKTLSERDLKHLDLAIERKEKMKSVVPLIEALIHLVVETLIEVGSNDENMSKLVFLLEKPTSMNLSDFHNKYIDEDNLYAVLSQAYSKDFLREIESSLRQRIKIFSDKMKPIV